jgi:hypothetical protein
MNFISCCCQHVNALNFWNLLFGCYVWTLWYLVVTYGCLNMLVPQRRFAPKLKVILTEHHMTWSCAYDVAMSLHASRIIHTCAHIIMSPLVHTWNLFGAYTCNRCAEDHSTSEAPQGVNPEAGVRSGAGGPVRRNWRRHGSRSWSRAQSLPLSVKASPGAL